MTTITVPSGTHHGRVSISRPHVGGEIAIEQRDTSSGGADMVVLAAEYARDLARMLAEVAADAAPAPATELTAAPDFDELDFYYASPAGEDISAIEVGGWRHRNRMVVVIRQVDGADEDGNLTHASLVVETAKLDHLISALHAVKGVLR